MSEDFGSDIITIVDDDGQEADIEVIDVMDYNKKTYLAALPAEMDENDPDYGLIILRVQVGEDNLEYYESIDDDAELNEVYEKFMTLLFDDEEDE